MKYQVKTRNQNQRILSIYLDPETHQLIKDIYEISPEINISSTFRTWVRPMLEQLKKELAGNE